MIKSESLQRVVANVRRWPQILILEHARVVGALALTAGLAVAVWLVLILFVFEAPATTFLEEAGPGKRLAGDVIDRLELWIEEVDAERRNGFPTPARPLFVIEDLLPES